MSKTTRWRTSNNGNFMNDDSRVIGLEKTVFRYQTPGSKKVKRQQHEERKLKPLENKRKKDIMTSSAQVLSDGMQQRFVKSFPSQRRFTSQSQRRSISPDHRKCTSPDHNALEKEYRASEHRANDPRVFAANTMRTRLYTSTMCQHPRYLNTGQNIFKFCAFDDLFKSSQEHKGFMPGIPQKHGEFLNALSECGDYISKLPARTLFNYINKEILVTGCSLNERQQEMVKQKRPKVYLSPPSSPDENEKTSSNQRLKRFKCAFFVLLKPNNVEQEKIKFIKSNFTYNPQFTYDREIDQVKLEEFNHPSHEYLPQALAILHQVLLRYGSYENFEERNAGKPLSKHLLWLTIKNYLKKEGFFGNVVVNLNEGIISRGSMTVVGGRPTLNIRPSAARSQWLDGLLRHEIGTHHIRSHNNRQQPWSSKRLRKKLGMLGCNPTEEGLASLHSVLMRKDPSLWRAALLYYSAYKAKHTTFVELFKNLKKFTDDVDVRWDYCMRTKRGRSDTSLPGGFCKDQVYLNGIIPLLRQRRTLDFEALVRLGKVAYQDIDRLRGVGSFTATKLPEFMVDMEAYRGYLDRIVVVNQLEPYLVDYSVVASTSSPTVLSSMVKVAATEPVVEPIAKSPGEIAVYGGGEEEKEEEESLAAKQQRLEEEYRKQQEAKEEAEYRKYIL